LLVDAHRERAAVARRRRQRLPVAHPRRGRHLPRACAAARCTCSARQQCLLASRIAHSDNVSCAQTGAHSAYPSRCVSLAPAQVMRAFDDPDVIHVEDRVVREARPAACRARAFVCMTFLVLRAYARACLAVAGVQDPIEDIQIITNELRLKARPTPATRIRKAHMGQSRHCHTCMRTCRMPHATCIPARLAPSLSSLLTPSLFLCTPSDTHAHTHCRTLTCLRRWLLS
jgi:hypothetical protein